jgi:hypothetical protein
VEQRVDVMDTWLVKLQIYTGSLKTFLKWYMLQYVIKTRKEVTKEWIKIHKEELYGMYASPNVIMVIKSSATRR